MEGALWLQAVTVVNLQVAFTSISSLISSIEVVLMRQLSLALLAPGQDFR